MIEMVSVTPEHLEEMSERNSTYEKHVSCCQTNRKFRKCKNCHSSLRCIVKHAEISPTIQTIPKPTFQSTEHKTSTFRNCDRQSPS